MSERGQKQTLGRVRLSALLQKRTLQRADRGLIFCLEIALNQVGNFQIVTFCSLA